MRTGYGLLRWVGKARGGKDEQDRGREGDFEAGTAALLCELEKDLNLRV